MIQSKINSNHLTVRSSHLNKSECENLQLGYDELCNIHRKNNCTVMLEIHIEVGVKSSQITVKVDCVKIQLSRYNTITKCKIPTPVKHRTNVKYIQLGWYV